MLKFEDMMQWSLPLAAEQIKNQAIWTKFRDITLENQSRLNFKDFVNLAWSFTKVDFADASVWRLIEEAFTKELRTHSKDPEEYAIYKFLTL